MYSILKSWFESLCRDGVDVQSTVKKSSYIYLILITIVYDSFHASYNYTLKTSIRWYSKRHVIRLL